ncbi:MAG: penicillin-binding protein 2 [Candidatus Moranbacteria bacterium]|nr:penicillin-binding protein 2 [Candidatus Moranbacteria bacterium]
MFFSHKKIVRKQKKIHQDWRISLLFLGFFLGFSCVIFRLYSLQIAQGPFYTSLAYNQHTANFSLTPKRGEVYLRNGGGELFPLALNKAYPTLYVVPREIDDVEGTIQVLSDELKKDKESLRLLFKDKNDPFEIVSKKVEREIAKRIKEKKLSGVYSMDEMLRYYPGEELASQVIGFVGNDGESFSGRYGIEASWDEVLHGNTGSVRQERDAGGRWISITDREFFPAQDGQDLILTLDAGVQYEVERVLKNSIEKHKADSASALVLEVGTGKILAMANQPSFDPNRYSSVKDMSFYLNPTITHVYESGSVFKPITMAIALDAGKISPETTYVDTGIIFEAGYEIMNSDEKSYGVQTMTQVLEESLNTGTIFAQKQVGNKVFKEYIERFGFGVKTGIELPSESAGSIKNLDHLGRNIHFYTASFGQGISMTLLQLAMSYDVIANGGVLMKPMVVDASIDSEGNMKEYSSEMLQRVISDGASQKTREMLYSVVKNGHGKQADVEGYRVGGKTGTAQVASKDSRGYSDSESIGTFAGLAPVDDPRFVVVVKVRNPKDVIWAESTAAPAFGEIMKFLLEYYNVEPTEKMEILPKK